MNLEISKVPICDLSSAFYSVSMDNNGHAIAGGDNGVFYSSDYGASWTLVLSTGNISSVYIDSNGKAIAGGYYDDGTTNVGAVWYSATPGLTWSAAPVLSTVTQGRIISVYIDSNGKAIAGGRYYDGTTNVGAVWYSATPGLTWSAAPVLSTVTQGRIISVYIDSNGKAIAGGRYYDGTTNVGAVWYSANSGLTWTEIFSGVNVITAVTMDNSGNAIVGGDYILLYSHKTQPISNICFPAGTPIQTDQGFILIDKINTSYHTINRQQILHITQTVTLDNYLICFEKDSLELNYPINKTIMTKDHKIMYNGQLVPAYRFLNMSKQVNKVKYSGEILFNVLLAEYGTISVNNLKCETLHPDNVIAKLYTCNFTEKYKQQVTYIMNETLTQRNLPAYKSIVNRLNF